MSDPDAAFQEWLRRAFDTEVRDDIFAGHAPAAVTPVLVLLGGQPAAGKTRAQDAILAELPELVPVTGDDLRQYDPEYLRLVAEDPLGMPQATAPVSAGLIRLALDHAVQDRFSVLLEGTFRDEAMVTGTAARFAAAGYRVEVIAVATPAPLSRLGAEQRFLAAPDALSARWTPPEAHETTLAASPSVVAALEASEAVSRVRIYSRRRLLYDNARTLDGGGKRQPAAAEILRGEQTRQLSPAEAAVWLARYQAVFDLARGRTGFINRTTAPAYQHLQDDAARLITIAATDPAIGIAGLRRQQRQRSITLRMLAVHSAGDMAARLRERKWQFDAQPRAQDWTGPLDPPRNDPPRNDPPTLGR